MRCLPSTSVALFACSLVACAGSLDRPERFDYLQHPRDAGGTVFDSDGGCDPVTEIFPLSCTTSACHTASAQQGGLDLESPGLPRRLVDLHADGGPGLLIDSKNPSQSVLLTKLDDPPPYGLQMPLTGALLSADEKQCIADWISAAVK